MNKKRKTLLSVPVDTYKPEEFMALLEKSLHNAGAKSIFAINPEKIMNAQKYPELLLALKDSDLLILDGVGTAIGLWLFYGEIISRTTGIGLMFWLLKLAAEKKYRVFIFGAKPHVNALAIKKIRIKYPGLILAGFHHGYLPDSEYEWLVEDINSSGTEILFVGLGSPLQEKWIYHYKKMLKAKICMGVGGSLDVLAGTIPGAPR